MSDNPKYPVSPPAPESPAAVPPPEPASSAAKDRLRGLLPWLITLVLVLLIAALVTALMLRESEPLPPTPKNISSVATMEVVPRTYIDSLKLPGRLEADRRAVISAEIGGRVEEWLVEEGAAVEAGAVLVRLNTDDLEARLNQLQASRASSEATVAVSQKDLALAKVAVTQAEKDAEALDLQLQSADAEFRLATQDYERIKSLAADNIATQADLDRSENALTQARLGVAKAKDAMQRAEIRIRSARVRVEEADATLALNRSRVEEVEMQTAAVRVSLDKMSIEAPFAGRFDAYLAEAGDVVSVGEPLGMLYDLSHLRVAVDVPDRYAPLMDPSSPMVQTYLTMAMAGAVQELNASVVIPGLPKLTGGRYAGVELPATIHRVSHAADPSSNTFRVELRMDNPGKALKEGIIANAKISFLRYENALVIPVKAIQVSERGPRVIVVSREDDMSIAQVRGVEVISISGNTALVRGELNGGDHLIVSGGKGILDGEEVKVVVADGESVIGDGIENGPPTIRYEANVSTGGDGE